MAINKTIIGRKTLPDGRVLEYGVRDPETGQRFERVLSAPTPTPTPTPEPTPTPTPTPTPVLPTGIVIPTGEAARGKQVRIGGQLYPSQEWYDVNVLKKKEAVTPTPTVDPNEQVRIDAANAANEAAQTIFDSIPKGEDIDMRDSTKILADIQTKFEKTEEKIPEPVSLVDLFESKKAELGIEALDTERADLLAEKDRLQATLFVEAEKAGEKILSTREISRAKGAIQKRFDREMLLLDVEISAVERMLSNKYSTLETILSLTQQDFSNISSYYTQQYNRQVQLFNILSDVEEKEYTRAEDAEKDAQINLQIIMKAMIDSEKTFDDLDASLQATITKLEIQSGLPAGITQAFYNEYPDDEVVYESKGTDAEGREFVSFISKDKDGNYSVKNVYTGGVEEVSGYRKFSDQEKRKLETAGIDWTTPEGYQKALDHLYGKEEKDNIKNMEDTLMEARGADGFLSPDDYKEGKDYWFKELGLSKEDYDKEFSKFANPSHIRDYDLEEEAEKTVMLTDDQFKEIAEKLIKKFKDRQKTIDYIKKGQITSGGKKITLTDDQINSILEIIENPSWWQRIKDFLESPVEEKK